MTDTSSSQPEWWPHCPWPEEVWPMTPDEYIAAVPDPKLRTAISGYLMRQGWHLACEAILERKNKEEMEKLLWIF